MDRVPDSTAGGRLVSRQVKELGKHQLIFAEARIEHDLAVLRLVEVAHEGAEKGGVVDEDVSAVFWGGSKRGKGKLVSICLREVVTDEHRSAGFGALAALKRVAVVRGYVE